MTERVRLRDLQAPAQNAAKIRWYSGYSGRGKADQLIENLSRYLRQYRLTDTVCGMRIERRPRGEFYFFLTFETDHYGELPPPVDEALQECPVLQFGAGGPYDLAHIESMVSGELKVKALGQCLAYRQVQGEVADDPFQAAEPTYERPDERLNHLLWYLSAVGGGRWSGFSSVCNALNLSGAGEARQVARALRLLGHIEFSADGDAWSVVRPTLAEVATPNGGTASFLCGARTPTTYGDKTPQAGGPDRLGVIETETLEAFQNPALTLSKHLPDLTAYQRSLCTVGSVSDLQHQFEHFDGHAFVKTRFKGEWGLYNVTSKNDRKLTLYYDGTSWRRGDWYGLRYLTLRDTGRLLPARHDAPTWELALRFDQRPSEIYERTLVLCSGLLPRREGEWLVYGNVPPEVASQTCERLELPLESAS